MNVQRSRYNKTEMEIRIHTQRSINISIIVEPYNKRIVYILENWRGYRPRYIFTRSYNAI